MLLKRITVILMTMLTIHFAHSNEFELAELYNNQSFDDALQQQSHLTRDERDHMTWWKPGVPPNGQNIITRYDQSTPKQMEQDIAQVTAYVRKHNVPIHWRADDKKHAALIAHLKSAGFRHLPLMLMLYQGAQKTADQDVVPITKQEVRTWLNVVYTNYGVKNLQLVDALRISMENSIDDMPAGARNELYGIYQDGALVTTGGLLCTSEYAKIKDVTTLEHARNKGLATKMLATLVARAAALQIPRTILEATHSGVKLYEEVGFVRVKPVDRYILDVKR